MWSCSSIVVTSLSGTCASCSTRSEMARTSRRQMASRLLAPNIANPTINSMMIASSDAERFHQRSTVSLRVSQQSAVTTRIMMRMVQRRNAFCRVQLTYSPLVRVSPVIGSRYVFFKLRLHQIDADEVRIRERTPRRKLHLLCMQVE